MLEYDSKNETFVSAIGVDTAGNGLGIKTDRQTFGIRSPTYLAALAYEYRYVCVRLEGDPWILVNRRRAGIHSPLRLLQDARVLT